MPYYCDCNALTAVINVMYNPLHKNTPTSPRQSSTSLHRGSYAICLLHGRLSVEGNRPSALGRRGRHSLETASLDSLIRADYLCHGLAKSTTRTSKTEIMVLCRGNRWNRREVVADEHNG